LYAAVFYCYKNADPFNTSFSVVTLDDVSKNKGKTSLAEERTKK